MEKSVAIKELKLVEEYGGTFFKGKVCLDGYDEVVEVVFPVSNSNITDYQYQCLERINLEWSTILEYAQQFPKAPKVISKTKMISIMIVDEHNEDSHIEIVLTYKKGFFGLPHIYSVILEDFTVTNIITI